MPRRIRTTGVRSSNPLDNVRRQIARDPNRGGFRQEGPQIFVAPDGTRFNLGFAGSEIDQQQRAFERQHAQAEEFDRATAGSQAVSQLQQQLLNQPAQTELGSVVDVVRSVDGGPATTVGAASGGSGMTVENPFTDANDPRLNDPSGQQFSDQIQRQSQALTSKAAAEYAAMGEALGRGVPPWRLRQAQQEFARRYPGFGQQLRPLSSEQASTIKQSIMLREAQQQADAFATQAGVPSFPLTLDEKGRPTPIPGYSEHVKAQAEIRRSDKERELQMAKQRERMFDNAVSARRERYAAWEKATKNPFDPVTELDNWQKHEKLRFDELDSLNRFEQAQRKRFFPEEFENQPEPVQTISRQQVQEARKLASSAGIEHTVVDEDDFAELQAQANRSGQTIKFIDAADNQEYEIRPE